MLPCRLLSLVILAVAGASPVRFLKEWGTGPSSMLDGDNVVPKKVLGENFAQLRFEPKIRPRNIQSARMRATTGFFQAFAAPAKMRVTNNVLPLFGQPGTSLSQRYLRLLDSDGAMNVTRGQTLIKNVDDVVYLTPIKFGDQSFMNVIDTGSADTWVVGAGVNCINHETREPDNEAKCGFAKHYVPTKTLVPVTDKHFNITYEGGEFLNGAMGKETVTLGNIQVHNQEFGIISSAAWKGDNVSSGLIGLAFPSATRAYPGNDPKADRKGGNIPYNPIFTNMWKQNLTEPVFSLALNRANEGPGVLAFGGLPGGEIRHEEEFAVAPLQYINLRASGPKLPFAIPKPPAAGENNRPDGAEKPRDYLLYAINVDGWSIKGQGGTGPEVGTIKDRKTQVVIDSGTTLSYLPAKIADAINKNWNPRATRERESGNYLVKCKSTPPKVGLNINGTMIWFDGIDMPLAIDPHKPKSQCISSIQSTENNGPPLAILGAGFLRGVVAVFDIGAAEMRLSNRVR